MFSFFLMSCCPHPVLVASSPSNPLSPRQKSSNSNSFLNSVLSYFTFIFERLVEKGSGLQNHA